MPRTISGTNADDVLRGTTDSDLIDGGRGKDTLYGYDGDDQLNGGAGGDRMIGGADDDTYSVDNTADRVTELADEGVDLVEAELRRYKLPANVENLTFMSASAHLGIGNTLDNVITGSKGRDQLFGGAGADTLYGGAGKDFLFGEKGNDILRGESGNDTLNGGAGNDLLDGGSGADTMNGGKGNDIYIVDNVFDKAIDVSSGGTDEVRATVDFKLSSTIEKLTLTGDQAIDGTGNTLDNILIGNDTQNVLDGGRGADTLNGGKAGDVLTGGEGADRFVFSSVPSSIFDVDLITDFSSAQRDKIVLSLNVFADFGAAGKISPDAFKAGAGAVKAADAGQFLIYDTTTGSLYYDAEGPDGHGPVKLAQLGLDAHPALAWSDFLIIG